MSEGEKTVIQKPAQKPKIERTPINGMKTKLTLTGEEPGFHYVWVNDENVGTFQDASYEFVNHPIKVGNRHIDVSDMQGAKISRNVGNGVVAYLMRVPDEFYQEDMKVYHRDVVDAAEERIHVEINSNGLNGKVIIGQGAWSDPNPRINKDG